MKFRYEDGAIYKGSKLVVSVWGLERIPDTQENREPGESWLDARNRLQGERERITKDRDSLGQIITDALNAR